MSAERVRRAATAIREDYCAAETDNGEDDPFMFAVADWLDATARELDALNDPDLSAHPQDGRRTAALAVANAYLPGETP